ncbi:hypothetical protein LSCM1_05382 [Leishmania martiniquensis]|uniref:Uncharacterized protein n=1 Tax=Leishmania martiniquensis TaxID=1580590 RepID=A0A836HHX0_9TRYP|nr:hypothetical protein LSCM1_05382 [Leishmania martiniquensis]
MPRQSAGGPTKVARKGKPVFDAFERVCHYTLVSLQSSQCSRRAAADAAAQPAAKNGTLSPAAAVVNGEAGEDGIHAAEFAASALAITPPLPRTEVSLLLQFRASVPLTEGDVIYIYLPKFRGPVAQQFALERVASTSGVVVGDLTASTSVERMDDINTASHFRAYWSGDSAKVVTPVSQLAFKRGKKGGGPPKQVLLLQCIKAVNANTQLLFSVPRALGLVSPDKLPVNSPKIKIEGPLIREASGRRILKQVILSCSGIKKLTVVEELDVYDECIARVAQEGRLQVADRHLGEQLSLEEVDQLWEAAQYRRRYPLPMPWFIAEEISVHYDAAGGFVKRIMQNAIKGIKDFDPLAVHREVARNWGVKVAAVVVLDGLLTTQWGGLYPGLPRASLFAICLLTMEPEDVARTFPRLLQLPERSIAEELFSAFRMRTTLIDATAPAPSAAAAKEDDVEVGVGGLPDRCGELLDKWAALLTAVLPASFVVEERGGSAGNRQAAAKAKTSAVAESYRSSKAIAEFEEGAAAGMESMAPDRGHRVGFQLPAQNEADSEQDGLDEDGMSRVRDRRRHSSETAASGYTTGAIATLRPPPKLYIGYRDVPFDVQRSLREMERGSWFVLPFVVVARQSLPYAATTATRLDGSVTRKGEDDGSSDGRQSREAFSIDEAERSEMASDGAVVSIPDNAVVVELQNVVEAVELADLSLSPHDRAWLLPLVTSCRVVAVEEDQHDVLHVILDMQGSLMGQVNDPFLPQGDRSVATMVLNRFLLKAEQTETYVSMLSFLSLLCARRNDRRRLHPPTLIRAQYLSHCNAAHRTAIAKQLVEETESVEWQVRTHEAQLLDEGVVKPAVWEPIPKKFLLTVEQFFLGHSRTLTKLEEGTLSVDLGTYTIDYGGKGPRALRRVVQKVYVTHEPASTETFTKLREREEQYTKQMCMLDAKLNISSGTAASTIGSGTGVPTNAIANGRSKKVSGN